MQEQKQKRKNGDKIIIGNTVDKIISDSSDITKQIKRDTSRLDDIKLEILKKRIQKLYMWVWALLGLSVFLFVIILLIR